MVCASPLNLPKKHWEPDSLLAGAVLGLAGAWLTGLQFQSGLESAYAGSPVTCLRPLRHRRQIPLPRFLDMLGIASHLPSPPQLGLQRIQRKEAVPTLQWNHRPRIREPPSRAASWVPRGTSSALWESGVSRQPGETRITVLCSRTHVQGFLLSVWTRG